MKKILILILLPLLTFAQKECVVYINTDQYPTETYQTLYADSLYGDTLGYVTPGHYINSFVSHTDTVHNIIDHLFIGTGTKILKETLTYRYPGALFINAR